VQLEADPIEAEANCETGTAEGLYYLHADHMGRPQFATDSGGNVVWDMGGDVTPFGDSGVNLAGAFAQQLMFPGQYADLETGGEGDDVTLSHNWHRTYDPTLGRYLQSDPIGLAGGLNRFAYVGGNPVGYVDPTGQINFSLNLGFDLFAFVVPGISSEIGFYFSTEGDCNTFEVGFYKAGSIGGGLDIAAGLGGDISFGRPSNTFEGYYVEAEGSIGPFNGNGFFSPNSGSGSAGGIGASLEVSPLPFGGHLSVGKSEIIKKWNFGNSSFLPSPYTRDCECVQ